MIGICQINYSEIRIAFKRNYFLPLLLRDLFGDSASSSDAGYATGDGENGGNGCE